MLSTTALLVLSLAAASIHAIPVPRAQTPDYSTLESCPIDGAIVCTSDGTGFYMCNFGKAVPMGAVAAGMVCRDGQIIAMDGSAAPPAPVVSSTVPPVEPISTMRSPTSMPPQPTSAAVMPKPVTPAPIETEPDTITSTITSTVETKITSTSTILVTLTGAPPAAATSASAAPSSPVSTSAPVGGGDLSITEDVVLKIAPGSASCTGADFPEECGTAKIATPFISQAFSKFKIASVGEAAAILSIMAFESADFKFNKNHFPGRPGQGTKAMLMPNFIVSYAQTFESTDSIQPGLTEATINSASDDVKTKVLELVLGNDRTYGSAAWFYSEKCSDDVKAGLKASPVTIAAWSKYITECINTTVTSDRQAGFVQAVEAFGGTTPA